MNADKSVRHSKKGSNDRGTLERGGTSRGRKKRGDGPLSREKWSVLCLTISSRLSAVLFEYGNYARGAAELVSSSVELPTSVILSTDRVY